MIRRAILPLIAVLFASAAPAAPAALAASPVGQQHQVQYQVMGIGGAGGMFTPAVSPADPNLLFISCDMGGVYRSADGGRSWAMLHWRQLCDSLRCRPAFTKDAVYWASGDTLKVSRDQGRTWAAVVEGKQPWQGEVTAIAVNDAGRIYVGSGAGVFVSADDGKRFAQEQQGKCAGLLALGGEVYTLVDGEVSRVADRGPEKLRLPDDRQPAAIAGGMGKSGAVLYAAGPFGILRSGDKGQTWQAVGVKSAATMVVMPPNQTDTAYAANAREVYVTHDGGRTWASCFRMESQPQNVEKSWVQTQLHWSYSIMPLGLGVSPSDPKTALVSTQGDFYITRNGGDTWTQLMNIPVGPLGDEDRGGGDKGDGDKGYRYRCNGLEVTSSWEYYFDPNDADRTYIAYTDIGFCRSRDRGRTWISAVAGCPWSNTFYQIQFDPKVKGRIYAACSTRHDIPHWTHVGPNTPAHKGGVCQSDDYGATWKVLGKGSLPELPCTSLVIDPRSGKGNSNEGDLTFYASLFEGGVYKSADGGSTWEKKNAGLGHPGNLHAFMLAIHPKTGDLFCSVTAMREGARDFRVPGGLFKSADGGDSWSDLTGSLALKWPTGFAVDPRDANTIYLAAATSPQHPEGGFYKTTDGGRTWAHFLKDADLAKSGGDSYSHCMFVTLHPDDPDVLYLSTGSHGLWISTDAGKTCRRVEAIPFRSITRVAFDPKDHKTMYVATFGGGVWRGPALP